MNRNVIFSSHAIHRLYQRLRKKHKKQRIKFIIGFYMNRIIQQVKRTKKYVATPNKFTFHNFDVVFVDQGNLRVIVTVIL